VTVIDVRPAEEFAAGHVPGAINVPLSGLGAWARGAPRGQEIVAYCRGPYCVMAFEAVAQLRSKGLRAQRLADGFPEWKSAGLPVEV
jgi:ArsR family transcriptional regulator